MSMEPKLAAYCKVSFDAEGAVVAERLYNCTVAGAGANVGDFTVTMNEGADRQLCQIILIPSGVAAAASTGTTSHTSDVAKRVQFRDAAGTLAAPAQAWVEIWRMPPLPAA